jgi:hypothetical protein
MHMPVGIQLFLVNSKSTCQIRQIRQMPNAKKDCRLKLPNSKQQTTNKPIAEEVGPGTWYIAGLAAGFGFAFVPVFGFRLPAGCGLPKAKSQKQFKMRQHTHHHRRSAHASRVSVWSLAWSLRQELLAARRGLLAALPSQSVRVRIHN